MSRSPKRLSSSAKKKRSARSEEQDQDQAYDDDRGVSGLSRSFRKGLSTHIAKKLGVKNVQVSEIKSFLKDEFTDSTSIDREDFLLIFKKYKSFERVDISKSELKRVYHAIDKAAGGFGSINYRDILQYISLGDKKMMKQLNLDLDDEDDEGIDKGVWGASPIVDVQLSTSDLQEARLQKDGYERVLTSGDVPANLNEGGMFSSSIFLWYRRRSQGGSGVRLKPLVDIILSDKLVDSALVIAGYTCLNKSTNKGTISGKNQYLWVRRAFTPEEEEKDAIVGIAVTKGNKKDLDNHVHKPPGRGFIHVPGDLNARSLFAANIFMWFRPITPRSAEKDWRYGVPDEERNYELEQRARRAIRQFVSPADLNFSPRGGPTDFAVLFNRHATSKSTLDKSRVGTLSVAQFGTLLKEVGLNIVAVDVRHLMHRIDSNGNGRMSREEFLSFVQLNDDQLDEVALKIRDFFGTTKGASQKKVLKAIRQRFKRLDSDGDGILDIDEFKMMVQMVGIFLTEPELMRLRRVFDPDGDGMIGKDEFESVVLGMDDTVKRQCIRVCDATQALRDYILQCQRELRKKGSKDGIDSESAWLDLERKHKRGVGGSPFPGYLDLEDVAQAVERLGYRLSQPETRMLIMRVAPDGDGRVSNVEFHEFSTEPKPRPIGELIGIMGKNKDALMTEAMSPKLKGSKLRKYMNRIITAIGPDDVGLVTFEVLANGLGTFFNYRERAGQPTDGELVSIAQYVGAVDVRFFMADPRLFMVGLRSECTGDDVAELLKLFEDDDDGAVYSDLLNEKKRNKSKSYIEEDEEDDDDDDDVEDEYEWIEVEVEEEVEKDDKVYDVCKELCDYFNEVSEVQGKKGEFDYELALNSIQEGRETGSLMDIENDFSGWLNELGEMEALSDEEFESVLERFDPKNTNLVGSKQIEAFCNGDSWSMEKEVEIVTKTERKKVKKKKTTKKSTPKRKGKRVVDSDDQDEGDFDLSDEDEEDDGSDYHDEDEDATDEEDDEDDDDDFFGRRNKRKGRKNRVKDSEDDEDDFISSPYRRGKDKKITNNVESDMLVRDIARSLGAKHRDLGSGLEQMVRMEFRKMDVFGNGLLRPEEINLSLKGLGYRKQVNGSSPGLKFFLDRGGNVDFNGLAQAIGQASWERDHSSKGGSVTGSIKLDKKVRTLAEDLKEVTKKMDKVLGKFSRDDGSMRRTDFKKGLDKLVRETEGDLTDKETKMFFIALNRECGGDGGDRSINLGDFRHFVKSSGGMLLDRSGVYLGSKESDRFDDDDVMDCDFQLAIDRCVEEFEDMDLSRKNKRKVRSWFENVDKAGKGTVTSKAFLSFLKKSKIGNNLSRREKDCLIKGLSGSGKGKVDYETFVERVVDGKRGDSGDYVSADATLGKMQEAANVSVRSGGGTYAMIFARHDPSGSGVVTKDGLVGAFRSIGCYLADDEVNMVSKRLKSRGDGMLDYNDLYQVLLQTTPRVGGGVGYGGTATPFSAIAGGTTTPWGTAGRGALGMSLGGTGGIGATPWKGGASELGQTWPPPGSTPWNTPFNPSATLGGSAAAGGGGASGDYMLQDVALKLRNAMRQRVSQWGPSVSLHRQFEASDPDRKGFISLKNFLMVLEHLGVQLVPVEVGIINRRFDRHGNDTIDYLDFCRFVSIDAREMEIVSSKLASKFAELRRRGVSASATFDVYDIGRTGFVSRRDFRECSRQLQLPVTENQLEALMGRFAHQGNGDLVSWQEFITFVNASGVNLPLDELEGPVMGDGYDGMDVWYNRGGGGGADRAGGTPKRGGRGGGGGGGDFREMYRSMGRKSDDWGEGWEGGGGREGAGGSMWVDHSSSAKDRTFTMDMKESRKVGREAVSYLDNHGVSTPKWIRSVLKVGQGKEGFDKDGGDDSDDGFEFGKKRISRSPLKDRRRKGRSRGKSWGRERERYSSDEDDSDWD